MKIFECQMKNFRILKENFSNGNLRIEIRNNLKLLVIRNFPLEIQVFPFRKLNTYSNFNSKIFYFEMKIFEFQISLEILRISNRNSSKFKC